MTLYSPDSALYQHMLSYKANLAESHNQDTDDSGSSDWEVLTADYYDGDSEISASSSYYSDEGDCERDGVERVTSVGRRNRNGHHQLRQRSAEVLDDVLEGESLEVEFYTPRSSKLFEESPGDGVSTSSSQVQRRPEQFRGRRGRILKVGEDLMLSSSSLHQESSSSRVQLFQSPGNSDSQVGSTYLSDDNRSYVTATLEGEEDGNFSERSTSDTDLSSPRPRSNAVMGDTEAGVPRSLNRYTQMSLGNLFASQKEPDVQQQGAKKLQRGSSLIVRGERATGKSPGSTGASPVPVWKSTPLVVGQSPQASV